ncbi:MAG: magnesium/cobalt transporter CorA [Myxococcales bacterium]|nr:MAG: magnesium/cobalt transporter CorA [Myxococcales bacterium]
MEEKEHCELEDLKKLQATYQVVWLNIVGLQNVELIQHLGKLFNLHPLALEDVVSLGQRPKLDQYEGSAFMVMHAPEPSGELEFEQYSMFVGENFVITIQERPGDCLEPVRDRLRRSGGHIRKRPSDYLAYAIFDTIVDHYFPMVEGYLEKVDKLENDVIANDAVINIEELHRIRHLLLNLRLILWPTRDVAGSVAGKEQPIFSAETRLFFRDTHDHTLQLGDMVDACRSSASELMDLYLSKVNARMGEVMKVLTLIATIFMPLSFIAGLYGMNFDRQYPGNMPELGFRYGYFAVLTLMGTIAFAFVFYFWKKGWIGRNTLK